METLFENVQNITISHIAMWLIGGILIYLAIKKDMEPTLLLPMGFGAILANLPMSGAVTQFISHSTDGQTTTKAEHGILDLLFDNGITNELFPLLLFIGIGAMIDFGPLISNPKMFLFGAAAHFGIFFTLSLAALIGFDLKDSASIAAIGTADGPTAIFVSMYFDSNYIGAILVAAYSYMALVPIIQPAVIKAVTTKKERLIRMEYKPSTVSQTTKILMPIAITVIAGIVTPRSVALVGFLMFGNLIRECGVLNSLSDTAQKAFANIITLMLGITVAARMQADVFLSKQTVMILGLGLIAFIFDTVGGVLFAKFLNLFLKNKVNPMIGAAGISAFPMSSRVIHKMGLKEDPFNFLLMHAAGANVSGQVASAIAGGLVIVLVEQFIG